MKFKVVFSLLFVCMCLLTGCEKESVQGKKCKDVIMAEADIEFGAYKGDSLQLIMTEGHYYTADEALPEVDTYEENYSGEYSLQLCNSDGKVIDSYPINGDMDKTEINFPEKFSLCIDDYNLDGIPDFTVGTAGSASMNIFYLYSIDDNKEIINIGKDITDVHKDFSIYFEKEDGSSTFYSTQWNNATGEAQQKEWEWNVAQNNYISK